MAEEQIRIGVTGATGFLGTHLCRALEAEGRYTIVKLDRSQQDLLDGRSLGTFASGLKVVYHLAGANRADPVTLIKVNTVGTMNLLEAVRDYAGEETVLIYLSSFQVYRPSEGKRPITESWPLVPESIYGVSKRAAEEVIALSGLPSIIFRASNIYGPGARPYYNSVVATFVHRAVRGQPLIIEGGGGQGRDFLYVGDTVDALLLCLKYHPGAGELFNLCSGRFTSVNKLVRTLKELTGGPIPVEHRPAQEPATYLVGDYSRAKKRLGWAPRTSIDQGLKETLKWFQEQYRG